MTLSRIRTRGHRRWPAGAAGAALLAAAVACAPAPSPAPAPASIPAHEHGAAEPARDQRVASDAPRPSSDAEFLRHMIPHHAQALQMTGLVRDRTSRRDIRLLAERIAVSQRDEIGQMQAWLRANGHPVPVADTVWHGAHATGAGHAGMPGHGMLSPTELERLAASRGAGFDRLFLEFMIRHHEGAITMVQQLFAHGGGQDAQLYTIASDVESDQRLEIARMRALLVALPSPGSGSR